MLESDPLSEVLQDLRLGSATYGRCELKRPWGIDFPAQKHARFHFVASGTAWLRGSALDPVALGPGDVVLLPLGGGHALADTPHGPTEPLHSFPLERTGNATYRLQAGGAGAATLLVCCSIEFQEPLLHPLLELLPRVLLVRRGVTNDPSLLRLLETMADEVRAQRIGAATVMARLADVVVARVVRAWVETQDAESSSWLAGIRDPPIGRALAAIHRHPGHPWTVGTLAEVAHMSRSAFADRFTSVVGKPPAQYLARWRMHLASSWLRNARLGVAEVAARLGYDSEASFSRAFKRLRGVPPSSLRRRE